MHTLTNLGTIAQKQREWKRAGALLEEALALATELGAKHSVLIALTNLAVGAWKQGRYSEALARHRQALLLSKEQGEGAAIAANLQGMAFTFASIGDMHLAVTLLSAAYEVRQTAGMHLPPNDAEECAAILQRARDSLGQDFTHAWDAGRMTTPDVVISLALEHAQVAASA